MNPIRRAVCHYVAASSFWCLTGCASPPIVKPENITIAVDRDGNIYWNDELVSCAELSARFAARAPEGPQIDFCGPLNREIPPAAQSSHEDRQP
jgi:hypothetical protein